MPKKAQALNAKKELRERITKAPTKPGVYRWLDAHGTILYIGKAKNLKNRLKSYVQKKPDASMGPWKLALIEKITDVDLTITETEIEALILETNLIKEHKPKYNVMMKDDKNYVYVRITVDNAYPSVSVVRQMEKDGAKYFGPFLKAYETRRALEILHELFPFQTCKRSIDALNKDANAKLKPCIESQIGRCSGLCAGKLSQKEYQERIEKVIRFFRGERKHVIEQLKEMMQAAAKEKKFEKAAKLRDTLSYIESLEEQQIVSDTSGANTDAIGIALQKDHAQVVVLQERGGKLINEFSFALAGYADTKGEILSQFIPQYYSDNADIPETILCAEQIEEQNTLEEWLSEKRGKKVIVHIPERGKKSKLLMMAEENAKEKIQQQLAKWEAATQKVENALMDLKNVLDLAEKPKRIECYDISHLGGTETVGSMVVATNGKADNKQYRSFTLRTIKEGEIDDYKALKEVLTRRLRHLTQNQKKKEEQWSDQGITFGKARKTELEKLKSIISEYPGTLEPETVNYKNYVVARKDDKNIIGFAALVHNHSNLFEIDPVWVHDTYRGSKIGLHLCRKVLKGQKKKIYILCKPHLEEYYALLGFRYVIDGPEILKEKVQDFIERYPEQEPEIIMMAEPRNQKEDTSLNTTPNLIVIDGGKGQLRAAMEVMKKNELNIPVISLAKREEKVFVPNEKNPVSFTKDAEGLFLLMRLRDEAHRFANQHRERRLKHRMLE